MERARFLVTEALNSPSIFQNQGRNSITLGGFIDQKTLSPVTPSTSTQPSQLHQSTSVSHETEVAASRQSDVMTTSPRVAGSSLNVSAVNGSISNSAAGSQAKSSSFTQHSTHSQLSTDRVSYSKVTSGAWQNSPRGKATTYSLQV